MSFTISFPCLSLSRFSASRYLVFLPLAISHFCLSLSRISASRYLAFLPLAILFPCLSISRYFDLSISWFLRIPPFHSRSLTLSYFHSFTLSFFHSLILSFFHSFILSFFHSPDSLLCSFFLVCIYFSFLMRYFPFFIKRGCKDTNYFSYTQVYMHFF